MGGRLSHNLRCSFNWHNRIRLGISADKDTGERGYDFWSPYLFLKDMGVLKELALGNFRAQFGLGLLLVSFFAGVEHEPEAGYDERDAQELTHVKGHALLKIHLDLLAELNEKAECEYGPVWRARTPI